MSQPQSVVTYIGRATRLGAVTGELSRQESMARLLGPARFGHVTAAVTILMLASAITLAFQLVCAKFVARNDTLGEKVSVYRSLRGKAWVVSLGIGAALFIMQKPVASYLNI